MQVVAVVVKQPTKKKPYKCISPLLKRATGIPRHFVAFSGVHCVIVFAVGAVVPIIIIMLNTFFSPAYARISKNLTDVITMRMTK